MIPHFLVFLVCDSQGGEADADRDQPMAKQPKAHQRVESTMKNAVRVFRSSSLTTGVAGWLWCTTHLSRTSSLPATGASTDTRRSGLPTCSKAPTGARARAVGPPRASRRRSPQRPNTPITGTLSRQPTEHDGRPAATGESDGPTTPHRATPAHTAPPIRATCGPAPGRGSRLSGTDGEFEPDHLARAQAGGPPAPGETVDEVESAAALVGGLGVPEPGQLRCVVGDFAPQDVSAQQP